jgi:hypothetical protein
MLSIYQFIILDKPITHADDGFDVAAGVTQLSTQAADVHVDRSRFDLPFEPPDTLEQPIA